MTTVFSQTSWSPLSNPGLDTRAKTSLAFVRDNVAEFIMKSMWLDDPTWHANSSRGGIVFGNVMFFHEGKWVQGDIEVVATMARFHVLLHPYHSDDGEPVWRNSLDGSQLEDLFIELADI